MASASSDSSALIHGPPPPAPGEAVDDRTAGLITTMIQRGALASWLASWDAMVITLAATCPVMQTVLVTSNNDAIVSGLTADSVDVTVLGVGDAEEGKLDTSSEVRVAAGLLDWKARTNAFDVVLVPGTLDQLAAGTTSVAASDEATLIRGIQTALGSVKLIDGTAIIMTVLHSETLKSALAAVLGTGYSVHAYEMPVAAGKKPPITPVLLVCKRSGSSSFTVTSSQSSAVHVPSFAAMVSEVQRVQWVSQFFRGLGTSSAAARTVRQVLLWRRSDFASAGRPRYSVSVVDTGRSSKSGVLLVPRGRERAFIFKDPETLTQMAIDNGIGRLLVVSMFAGHDFADLKAVQNELSPAVRGMALSTDQQMPYMVVDRDTFHAHNIVCERTTASSGKLLVEEVMIEGTSGLRRMVFGTNEQAIQSEAKLIKRKGKASYDYMHLGLEYQQALVTGLALQASAIAAATSAGKSCKTLVLGLGGGALPMFLHKAFPSMDVTSVELDPVVAEIAQEYFGFVAEERCKLIIGDALTVVADASGDERKSDVGPFDIVIVDVDAKDTSTAAFLEQRFLNQVRSILTPTGMIVINFACRTKAGVEEVLTLLRSVFPAVHSLKVPENINTVLFCSNAATTQPVATIPSQLAALAKLAASWPTEWQPSSWLEHLYIQGAEGGVAVPASTAEASDSAASSTSSKNKRRSKKH